MAGTTLTWNIHASGFEATQRHLERIARMDMSSLLPRIGEYVRRTTQERFRTQTDHEGKPWQKLSEITKARKQKNRDKILTERGYLRQSINWQLLPGGKAVAIGTPMIYGATHQFGAKKHTLGPRTPWGDIPARPFLGLSEADKTHILALVQRHLQPI